MQLRLFLAIAICLLSLSSCSRESSITENRSLRNNHSVVFASKTPFKDPQAFADSIANLANPDSVIAHDTLTITVNDTIYLMGFLKYNADKIYRYAWSFINPDSTLVSKNATMEKWVFSKPSGKDINCPAMKSKLYCPLFIAVDGNNARDTAGKDQFIRVIDTPPYLTVPKDTLWTRAKSSITFPIVALDSFGTITNIKVDLDASKKGKAKEWKVEKKDGSDTMLVTIQFDSTKVDSIGNQKIYVIATDDDDNETLDSVNLHFNQLPTLELLDPKDDGRYDISERFAFFYKANDVDNPGSLRYFIRVAKSRDNYGTPPVLTDNDLIAKGIKDKSYEPKAAEFNDSNVIVTLKDPKTILSGKLFWDVWVTDGYDTVYSTRIKEADGTLRPWKFFYGNLKDTTGNFIGYVKYEGWSHHSGIRIVFQDSLGNRKYTHTADDGSFSITVKSGIYEMIAMDTTGYGFKDTIATDLFVDVSSNKDLGTMILRDTANPVIIFSDVPDDTINTSSLLLEGKFRDHGSQVKTATAILDKDTLQFNSLSWSTWNVSLDSMEDGAHTFSIFAQDSAGNKSDSTINFVVKSTSIHIAVNGNMASMQEDDKPFVFTAEVSQTSIADSLIWISNTPGFTEVHHKLNNFKDTIRYAKASEIGTLEEGKYYEMYAMTPSGVKSNVVRFGVLGNDPLIYFQKPSNDTTISLNDTITFSIFLYPGKDGTGDASITQQGDGSNRSFSAGTIESNKDETIHWNKAGTKKIIITYTNGKTVSDTLRVNVIEDPPTIKILNKQNNTRKKINSTDKVQIKAYDKFGIIQEINWTCSNNPITFDNNVAITPNDTVTAEIEFTMPGTETSNYKCVVQAIDNDNVSSYDTITYDIMQSKPVLTLFTKNETITINDNVNFDGEEKNIFSDGSEDTGARITDRMFFCDSIKKNLASINDDDWTHISKLDTNITAPNVPCTWYCVVRIDNSENASSRDTATYTVLLDPPWVNVSEDHKSVTIKDTVGLDARSGDGQGRIVKYEWGCAPKGSAINYNWSSTSTPHHDVVMPSSAESDYRCVIRVTDDDGLTATDTTHINVVLAPPTVTVTYKNITTRANFKINLDADAKDADNYDGYIVKREWSCGEPSEIQNHWKTVSTFDTSWKAPNSSPKQYYCIARATDDDGNIAMDTSYVSFTTEIPTLAVKAPIIYINLGEPFDLDATINSAWQGVNWFNWQCFSQSGKAMESSKNWTYKGSFYDVRLDTTSYIRDPSKLDGIDTLFCIIKAQEASSDSVFSDTTRVRIMRQHPKGVITAADTVYLWSGDETVDNNARYFYTNEWGGFNSEPGELGDPNQKYEYRWRFSNIGSTFYQGRQDGSLDTSSYEFNTAFKRPTSEGSMVISLDFRDSIAPSNATKAFYARHTGDTVSRTIYFSKAWKNLATNGDTVLANSKMRTGPALTTLGSKPYIAYLSAKNTVQTRYLSGSSWQTISTSNVSARDSIIKLQLANNGTDLYMGLLTSGNILKIYKSASGTSAWSKVGDSLSCKGSFELMVKSSGPVVLFINNSNSTPYFATLSNSKWTATQISEKGSRLITGAFTSSGSWVAVYVGSSDTYKGYYALYNSSNSRQTRDKEIAENMNAPKLTIGNNNNTAYLAFLNRGTETYGPYVYKGTINTSDISWDKNNSPYSKSITPGRFAYRIDIAAKDGKIYTIFDDASANSSAQSHVYQLNSSKWNLYGENELPYFKAEFYSKHNYYLRGAYPNIAIDNSGDVYISMLAWENGTGGAGQNFGPIVMKYAAKNWLVNDK